MSMEDHPDFDKLMQSASALDTHFASVAKMTRQEMLKARLRGDTATANKFKTKLTALEKKHEEAWDELRTKLNHPDQLRKTQQALRDAADKAHDFVKKLRKVKVTLDKLTEAATFLTGLLKQLRKIL